MQRLVVPFEIKELNSEDPNYFYFEGYGSVFGNIDYGDDKVSGQVLEKVSEPSLPKPKG